MLIAIKGFVVFPYGLLLVLSVWPTYLGAPIDFWFTFLFLKYLLRQSYNNKILLNDLVHTTFLGASSSSDCTPHVMFLNNRLHISLWKSLTKCHRRVRFEQCQREIYVFLCKIAILINLDLWKTKQQVPWFNQSFNVKLLSSDTKFLGVDFTKEIKDFPLKLLKSNPPMTLHQRFSYGNIVRILWRPTFLKSSGFKNPKNEVLDRNSNWN